MKNPYAHLPKSPVYEDGRVSSTLEYPWGFAHSTIIIPTQGNGITEPMFMDVAFNKDGQYIGNVEDANFMWTEFGIIPEAIKREDGSISNTCSIGKGRDNKWYGWSHRALYGFQVGDSIGPGSCGFKPSTVDDVYDELYFDYLSDCEHPDGITKNYLSITVVPVEGEFEVTVGYNVTRKDGSQFFSGDSYRIQAGKGSWVAETEDDAKQMAIDFAQSVSSSTNESNSSTLKELKLLTRSEFADNRSYKNKVTQGDV